MSRLSIVIPVYQHADACLRCLASLNKQTRLPDEVVIVDDGSSDDLEKKIAPLFSTLSYPVRFIRLPTNQGAPAARNEGARQTTGEYLLFLDADIELHPTMLEVYERTLNEHPEVDVVYCSHEFGRKLFPMVPYNVERLKQTNFIHTTSLLRRKAFPGFDEALKKFQDWDLWLTMSERGSKMLGISNNLFQLEPRSTGYSQWLPSFIYSLPWKKIGWTPRLVKKYQDAEQIIRVKHGNERKTLSIETSQELPLQPNEPTVWKQTGFWVLGILFIEVISAFSVFYSSLNTVLCFLIGVVVFLFAIFRPTLAAAILGTEFIIGSKGALFKAFGDTQNNGGVSVRIVLFGAFMAGWGINWLRSGEWRQAATFLKDRWQYLILALVLLLSFIQGILRHSPFVFADANAWVTWFLLLPALDLARRAKQKELSWFWSAIVAALAWSVIKTSILFYLFSHAFPVWLLEPTYLWIRRTGVGEVTRAGGNAFRIFFQSHIYAVILLPGLLLLRKRAFNVGSWVLWGIASLLLAQTLISLSRSFFLGIGVAGLVSGFVAWRQSGILGEARLAVRWVQITIGAIVVVSILFFFPLPFSPDSSLLTAWQSRVTTGDAASGSRRMLFVAMKKVIEERPLIGSGFGATVTYTTQDPRIVQSTSGTGVYTTYAFEWGWLEHWVKFGVIGIPLIGYILWSLGKRLQQTNLKQEEKTLLILSLVALAAVHISTPYLNHPLGFAWIILLEGVAERGKTG